MSLSTHTHQSERSAHLPAGSNQSERPVGISTHTHQSERSVGRSTQTNQIELVRWTAGLGAVTAEALAVHLGVSKASAQARLRAAAGRRLLQHRRPLTGRPALYAATHAGLRAAGVDGIEPCAVSAGGALHLMECARVAAALERCYPDHGVQGERELRAAERASGHLLASAELGAGAHGAARRHRPDLVLWPASPDGGLPVAVEVELTVKAPERLAAICRAWARTRCVAGVLYIAPPEVDRAVWRAIERAQAHERVLVVPLDALPARPDF
jgi:hypothetical protein